MVKVLLYDEGDEEEWDEEEETDEEIRAYSCHAFLWPSGYKAVLPY